MVRAYGYVRVSGKGQIDGDGFTRQESEIMGFAEKAKIDIVEIFREAGISGTKGETERPAFQEMLSAILKNGVRTVVVEGLDRMAREYRVQETLLIYLASKDVTLINARTGEDVTAAIMGDPMKKALVQMQGVFSELEKSLLVKKLRGARERKREQNGKCEGRKGYVRDHQEIVSAVKKLRRKPRRGKRLTAAQIAEKMNGRGLKTVTGRVFTGQIVSNILFKAGKG